MAVYVRDGQWRARFQLTGDAGQVVGFIDYAADEDRVIIGGRSVIPKVIEVEMQGDGYQPALSMRIETVNGVPMVRRLLIESVEGGREVTAGDVRAVRPTDWLEVIVAAAAEDLINDGAPLPARDANTERAATLAIREARKPRRITPEVLDRVAEVYRANVDGKPVQAVSKSFGVGASAAGAYVLRARKAGLLPPTTPGKKQG